jgi:hypothetical protein
MNADSINWLAVMVAALSAFMLGGLWYSPALFAKAWIKESNLNEEELKKADKVRPFLFTFIFSVIMCVNLAFFLADTPTQKTDIMWGLTAGILAGVWGFCAIAITALFEQKSWKYIFINGGYILFALGLMGLIIGAWR